MATPKQAEPNPEPHDSEHVASPDRRGALQVIVMAGTALYAGAIVVPAASFATATAAGDGESGRWIRVGRLSDLKPGEPKRLSVVGDQRDAFTLTRDEVLGSVWLNREGDHVTAMNATCPHLGCSIDLGSDQKSFSCPCHASRFALDGKTESGPSPRGMDPMETRVVEGFVEVSFKRYRIGIVERVAQS